MESKFKVRLIPGALALKSELVPSELEQDGHGLTKAQRTHENSKGSARQELVAKQDYNERVEQFNEKLAKETEHFEMPRISGQ